MRHFFQQLVGGVQWVFELFAEKAAFNSKVAQQWTEITVKLYQNHTQKYVIGPEWKLLQVLEF